MYLQKGFSIIDLMSLVAVVGIVFAPSFGFFIKKDVITHQYLKIQDDGYQNNMEYSKISFKYKICELK